MPISGQPGERRTAVRDTSIFWDQLLELIEEGRVVPVVGQDLLTVPGAGGRTLLYPYLAERLTTYLGVTPGDLPQGNELDAVACRYLAESSENPAPRIYTALKKIAGETDSLPVPEPLLQLAAIEPFRLFVTTTFDSFLCRALNEVRFGGAPKTRVLTYSPGKKEDLPGTPEASGVPTVYHLLGKLSATPNYAVTQWDLVEFFHAMQSETRRPDTLFDELSRHSLLIVGSSLAGWLARFFMRMAKGQFTAGGQTADYIADAQMSGDSTLLLFLQRGFNRSVEIFREGGAVEFVGELYQRWSASHPVRMAGPRAPKTAPAQTTSGAVFLSYASEDRPAVEKIKTALEAAGVDVFFDKDDLRAGELWESKLRRSIRDCSLFIPVVSRQAMAPGRRFFRVEWNMALEEAQMAGFSAEDAFLLPVVIDDTRVDDPGVPERFRFVQWQSLQGGEASAEFVAQVQQLYRKYQKSMAAGSR